MGVKATERRYIKSIVITVLSSRIPTTVVLLYPFKYNKIPRIIATEPNITGNVITVNHIFVGVE